MQEIQFLEFMGGSNSTHAYSNYLICMRFIQISTVASCYGTIRQCSGYFMKVQVFAPFTRLCARGEGGGGGARGGPDFW